MRLFYSIVTVLLFATTSSVAQAETPIPEACMVSFNEVVVQSTEYYDATLSQLPLFGPFEKLVECIELEGQINRLREIIDALIEAILEQLRRRDPMPLPPELIDPWYPTPLPEQILPQEQG